VSILMLKDAIQVKSLDDISDRSAYCVQRDWTPGALRGESRIESDSAAFFMPGSLYGGPGGESQGSPVPSAECPVVQPVRAAAPIGLVVAVFKLHSTEAIMATRTTRVSNFIAGRNLATKTIRALRAAGADACCMDRRTYGFTDEQPQLMHDALRTICARPELLAGFAAVLTDMLGDDGSIADIGYIAALTPKQIGRPAC
jgi:hypothetical protein